jgi:hypothetical protein
MPDWERAYGTAYTIQVSNDVQTWTTAYTQPAGQGGTENFTFPAVTGRYVRLYGTARVTQYGYSLYEFQVYAPPVPTIVTQPVSQTAVAGAMGSSRSWLAAMARLRISGFAMVESVIDCAKQVNARIYVDRLGNADDELYAGVEVEVDGIIALSVPSLAPG